MFCALRRPRVSLTSHLTCGPRDWTTELGARSDAHSLTESHRQTHTHIHTRARAHIYTCHVHVCWARTELLFGPRHAAHAHSGQIAQTTVTTEAERRPSSFKAGTSRTICWPPPLTVGRVGEAVLALYYKSEQSLANHVCNTTPSLPRLPPPWPMPAARGAKRVCAPRERVSLHVHRESLR